MRLLLDTHVFIWMVTEEERLSERAADALADSRNELFLSSASGWEMAIKVGLQKLDLRLPIADFLSRAIKDGRIDELPVRLSHVVWVARLPHHHRDPFDRLLVAQAQAESLTIVSADPVVARYGVDVIW